MPLIPKSFCTFANNMETTIIEDDIFEIGTFFRKRYEK